MRPNFRDSTLGPDDQERSISRILQSKEIEVTMGASLYDYRVYRSKAELEGTDYIQIGPG